MNLKHLSDHELWTQTKDLATQERKLKTETIWFIKEVAYRKLYLKRGYSNLFKYVVEELGYTPGSAMRRIKAMKLLRELPEVVQKNLKNALNSGSVSLVNVSQLQYFFEKEKKYLQKEYTQPEKVALLDKIENKTQEECQRLLFAMSSSPEQTVLPKERKRVVSETKTELKIIIDKSLMQKLQRLKELTAHKNPNPTYAELFEMAVDHMLGKIDPIGAAPKGRALAEARSAEQKSNILRVPQSELEKKFSSKSHPIEQCIAAELDLEKSPVHSTVEFLTHQNNREINSKNPKENKSVDGDLANSILKPAHSARELNPNKIKQPISKSKIHPRRNQKRSSQKRCLSVHF